MSATTSKTISPQQTKPPLTSTDLERQLNTFPWNKIDQPETKQKSKPPSNALYYNHRSHLWATSPPPQSYLLATSANIPHTDTLRRANLQCHKQQTNPPLPHIPQSFTPTIHTNLSPLPQIHLQPRRFLYSTTYHIHSILSQTCYLHLTHLQLLRHHRPQQSTPIIPTHHHATYHHLNIQCFLSNHLKP